MLKRLTIAVALTAFLVSPMAADDLGPAPTSAGAGSDPGTLNILQPAGSAGIPSANAQGGGVSLPDNTSSSLQPAGTKADFPASLDIDGQADGPPHNNQPGPATSNTNKIIIAIISALLLICAILLFRISKAIEPTAEATEATIPSKSSSFIGEADSAETIPEIPAVEATPAPKTTQLKPRKKSKRNRKNP